MYKINKQQGYIVQHREVQPLFCNNFKWSTIYKNTESVCCTLKLKQYFIYLFLILIQF